MIVMNKPTTKTAPVPVNNHKVAPENKDNLDSRKREEFDTKGDDITHNKKEAQSDRAKVKNNMAK